MNFIIKNSRKNLYNLMRELGYHFITGKNAKEQELIFVRPARGYPRFHIYLKIKNNNLIFNLHLDQKKPIYKGVPAHSAEYKSEIVKKEAKRIKQKFIQ